MIERIGWGRKRSSQNLISPFSLSQIWIAFVIFNSNTHNHKTYWNDLSVVVFFFCVFFKSEPIMDIVFLQFCLNISYDLYLNNHKERTWVKPFHMCIMMIDNISSNQPTYPMFISKTFYFGLNTIGFIQLTLLIWFTRYFLFSSFFLSKYYQDEVINFKKKSLWRVTQQWTRVL